MGGHTYRVVFCSHFNVLATWWIRSVLGGGGGGNRTYSVCSALQCGPSTGVVIE